MRFLRHGALFAALLLPLVAVVELVGNWMTANEVPPMESFRPSADAIRKEHRDGDLVVFAPAWMTQTRVALGEWMTFDDEVRSDTFDHPRIWELALEGRSSPETEGLPVLSRRELDRLTLTLYRNTSYRPAVWRAYDEVAAAKFSIALPEGEKPCPWDPSAKRHSCGPVIGEPWVWLGQQYLTDVGFMPRRCLWNHPTERGPLRTRFDEVPGGTKLTVHTGLAYAAYRDTNWESPVYLEVEIDGRSAGRIVHRGDVGWTTTVYDVPPGPERHSLAFVVTTPKQGMRHFCWDAAMRVEPAAEDVR